MTHYKKNTFEEIKNFLENFSINISTNIKSDEIFFGINSITKASVKNITFYNDYKYLLQLRDNNPATSYPNTWSFFAGEVDEGEDFEEALERELVEELFWCPDKLFYLAKSTNKKDNCNITYYIVHCETPEKRLILGEGQAMKWFTIQEIMDLDSICRPNILITMIKQAHNRIKSL